MSNTTSNPSPPTPSPANRNPYTLWFVILIFAAPVVGAYMLYFFGDIESFSNNGDLLQPVVDFDRLQLTGKNGKAFTRDALEHKWHMMLFTWADCDAACSNALINMRQINKAVGKHAYRLRHMVVHLQPASESFETALQVDFPATIRSYGKPDIAQKALAPTRRHADANNIFLVDPLGNIMMSFPPQLNPKLIIKDLNKLFKVSQIG